MSTTLIGIAGLGCYLAATLLGKKTSALALGLAGLLLHAVVLWQLVVQHWVNLGFFHALSFAGALLTAVTFLVARRFRLESLWTLVFPIAAFGLLLELLNPAPVQFSHQAGGALDSHILLSLLAYSFIMIGAMLASIALMQEHLLKAKKLTGILQSLPPLIHTEQALFQVISIGFILLTASLASGFIFLDGIFEKHLAHKTFFSILSWLTFAVLLLGRARYGWRGSLATKLALGGFILILLAYFGSKLVLELLLA